MIANEAFKSHLAATGLIGVMASEVGAAALCCLCTVGVRTIRAIDRTVRALNTQPSSFALVQDGWGLRDEDRQQATLPRLFRLELDTNC